MRNQRRGYSATEKKEKQSKGKERKGKEKAIRTYSRRNKNKPYFHEALHPTDNQRCSRYLTSHMRGKEKTFLEEELSSKTEVQALVLHKRKLIALPEPRPPPR